MLISKSKNISGTGGNLGVLDQRVGAIKEGGGECDRNRRAVRNCCWPWTSGFLEPDYLGYPMANGAPKGRAKTELSKVSQNVQTAPVEDVRFPFGGGSIRLRD